MSREQDFINRVVPACRVSALKYGYHIISVPVAQAILESGWGTCYQSQFNNILGIKAYNNEPYERYGYGGGNCTKKNTIRTLTH